ncbi:MAG: cation:proton antiporter domain-containing protein, partial [Roseovarius sp.]
LAASMDIDRLMLLDWRAAIFVAVTILLVRPVTVLLSLLGSGVPMRERLLVALTGPRGVVLVAVAGLFGERLVALGFEDAARLAPLAFALVAATVVLHGFALAPMARALGLAQKGPPGVILVGGSAFSVALGEALKELDVPVLVSDPNHARLRAARAAGLDTFFGDILSEAAENRVELVIFGQVVALTDNDAYNTLVTTDLAPEFGRDNVFQLRRAREEDARHALPATLGGKRIGGALDYRTLARRMTDGWRVRTTRLSADYTAENWRADNPEAVPLFEAGEAGALRFVVGEDAPRGGEDMRITALAPPRGTDGEAPPPTS